MLDAFQAQKPAITVIVALAAIAASLAIADPYLSAMLPDGLWQTLYLEHSPYKITPLAFLGVLAVTLLAWGLMRTNSFSAAAILLLLIAGQCNGLRYGPLDLFDVTLLILFLTWTASRLGKTDGAIMTTTVVWAVLALALLTLPNILHQNPVRFVSGSVAMGRCLLLVLLLANILTSAKIFDFAVRALIAIAVASAVIGITQFLAGYFFGAYFTFIDPPDSAFKPTPLGMVMRASSLAITAQHYSSFLTLILPFLLFAITSSSGKARLCLVVCLGLILAGILVSWNYGAIFATAGVFLLFPFWRWPRWSIQFALLCLLGVGVAYFTGLLDLIYDLSFGDSGVAKGVSQRNTLTELGLNKLYRNPWIGEGVQGMASFSGNFWGRPVHNAYLQTMTEIGMVGGWLLIGLLLLLTTQLFIAGATTRNRMTGHVRAALIAVLALMTLMMSEPMMDHANTWLILGMAQSALLIALREPNRQYAR